MIRFDAKTQVIVSDNLTDDIWELIQEEHAKSAGLLLDSNVTDHNDIRSMVEFLDNHLTLHIQTVQASEPTTDMVNEYSSLFRASPVDLFIAIGGGSVIDLTKAISVMVVNEGRVEDYHGTGKPFLKGVKKIAVPTTAGTGSEVTPGAVLVNTSTKFKRGVGGRMVSPNYAVLYAPLTMTMPDHVMASTGMDALGHAIESYTAKNANYVTQMYSKQAFSLVFNNLNELFSYPADIKLRKKVLLGSCLAGFAIYNSNTGACHSMAYPLGIYHHIPHGLAILANIIRKKTSANCHFLDVNAYRYSHTDVRRILSEMRYDVVFIGGLIPVYKRIIGLSRTIKTIHPNCIIVAGGSAAMSVPQLLLENSDVDVVCTGEGEKAVVELLNGMTHAPLRELTDIKGFYFKIDGEIFFSGDRPLIESLDDDSDLPAYDLLPMEVYLSNPVVGFGKDIDFVSSRGCPFHCAFCYQPWGRQFRAHSVEFIIDGIQYLTRKFDIDFISFQDDEFMAQPARVHEFCSAIQSKVPGLRWSCTGRVNIVTDELVFAMREAGCVSISYGFESGSKRMLKSMRKQTSIQQMEKAVRLSRKYGMMIPVSFIIGMPGEDEASCQETINFCIRNNLSLDSLMYATPYPGTDLFRFAMDTGRLDKANLHEYILNS